MRNKFRTIYVVGLLFGGTSVIAFESNPILPVNSGQSVAKQLTHEVRDSDYRNQLLKKLSAFGYSTLSDDLSVIQAVVYVHPLYLEQSLLQGTKSNGDVATENGASFALNRVRAFIDDINLTLLNSGLNILVELKFVAVLPDDFPITSSTGVQPLKTPDGLTEVKTDAEYFDLLVTDWDGAIAKHGFNVTHPVRKIHDASSADIHIYLRPFIDENAMAISGIADLDSFSANRPLLDGEFGFGYSFSSMTIYDPYWLIGAQGLSPLAGYALRTAPHQFGHVLGAGHEKGVSGSVYTYGNAYSCGGVNTVMHSSIGPLSYPIFSSPANFIKGEPCGKAIGTPGEADNTSVIRKNAPLLAAVSEPVETDNEIYVFAPVPILEDGERASVDIYRTGDLSKKTYVSLYAEPGTGRESIDYDFQMQTIEIAEGEDSARAVVSIPNRNKTSALRTFAVTASHVINGSLAAGFDTVQLQVAPNDSGELNFSAQGMPEEIAEGKEFSFNIIPIGNLKADHQVRIEVSSPVLLAGVNYDYDKREIKFNAGRLEPEMVTFQIFDDKTYRPSSYLDVSVFDGGDLVTTHRVKVSEISLPKIGVVKFQTSEITIDSSIKELIVRLQRALGTDSDHTVRLQLVDAKPADNLSSVVLPEPVTFHHGELEKTVSIGLSASQSGNYVFDVYSENKQEIMDRLNVAVNSQATLPSVSVTQNVEVRENAGFATITLTRSHSAGKLTLNVAYEEGSAKIGLDFSDQTKVVEFLPGISSVGLQVPIIDVKSDTTDRSFVVKFSSDQAVMAVNQTRVSIIDVKNTSGDDGKIDRYESGSFGVAAISLLFLICFRRKLR